MYRQAVFPRLQPADGLRHCFLYVLGGKLTHQHETTWAGVTSHRHLGVLGGKDVQGGMFQSMIAA
jgi:hypothetical protein